MKDPVGMVDPQPRRIQMVIAHPDPEPAAARQFDGHDLWLGRGKAGMSARGMQIAQLLAVVELDQLICSGVPRDGEHTYVLFADRVPNPRRLDRELLRDALRVAKDFRQHVRLAFHLTD